MGDACGIAAHHQHGNRFAEGFGDGQHHGGDDAGHGLAQDDFAADLPFGSAQRGGGVAVVLRHDGEYLDEQADQYRQDHDAQHDAAGQHGVAAGVLDADHTVSYFSTFNSQST